MAEGSEISEPNNNSGNKNKNREESSSSGKKVITSGQESSSRSSTESLITEETRKMSDNNYDVPLKSRNDDDDDDLLFSNCTNGDVKKSTLFRERRSKTPPPPHMNKSDHHYHQTNSSNFNGISTLNIIKLSSSSNNRDDDDIEKSRDSGVHLDEMSSVASSSGDDHQEDIIKEEGGCPTVSSVTTTTTTTGSGYGSANNNSNISHNIDEPCSSNNCEGDVDPTRRHSKSSSLPHGVKLCPESGNDSKGDNKINVTTAASSSSLSSEREDETKWVSLEEELRKAQTELKAKDAEVEVLKGIRQQVEGELEDLTASLFEEAHKMVKEAKMKEVASEKSLKEAKMQLEGLQAEVAALKALLITSTPSRPNLGGGNGISIFKKQHKRTPSHNHLQYGRSDDESSSSEKSSKTNEVVLDRSRCDVDPILLSHFAAWRVEPTLIREKDPFLQNIYKEDIDPCLTFANESLVSRLKKAIEDNSIWVEPLPEKDRTMVPKECALLCCPKICHYRMRFAFESDDWFDISQICRDRIAAVCEFLNYLRYIKNGLVKASVEDAYWEMLRLRKQMTLAKLGIAIS